MISFNPSPISSSAMTFPSLSYKTSLSDTSISRHLVVIVYKWKRSDNESEERRGQFKVPGKFAPYVSYHRPGRERMRMRSGERRVGANERRERAPLRRGLCALGVLFFASIV